MLLRLCYCHDLRSLRYGQHGFANCMTDRQRCHRLFACCCHLFSGVSLHLRWSISVVSVWMAYYRTYSRHCVRVHCIRTCTLRAQHVPAFSHHTDNNQLNTCVWTFCSRRVCLKVKACICAGAYSSVKSVAMRCARCCSLFRYVTCAVYWTMSSYCDRVCILCTRSAAWICALLHCKLLLQLYAALQTSSCLQLVLAECYNQLAMWKLLESTCADLDSCSPAVLSLSLSLIAAQVMLVAYWYAS
jgi:hypothetical protein